MQKILINLRYLVKIILIFCYFQNQINDNKQQKLSYKKYRKISFQKAAEKI